MKFVKAFLSVFILALLITSCKSKVSFKKTKGGVAYKIFPAGISKDTIGVGNIVKYNMTQRVTGSGKVKDSLLGTTYGKMPQFAQVQIPTGSYGDPLMEILLGAKKGDSIYFTQVMDSFIARQPDIELRTPFRKGDKLVTTIRIVDVFKSDSLARADISKLMEEESKGAEKKLEKYIADHHIQAQKTASGLYLEVLSPGQGPKPDSGQFANVKYRGTLLSGEKFDEGVYPLQLGMHGSIPGFEEAVKNMQKGAKLRAYIPAGLAYGARGNGPVGPNENLIFDMELLDISNKPPAQAGGPAVADTAAMPQK
jgi:FKBP-type peptidyl-prolyl cis-trans isomerase FkpA